METHPINLTFSEDLKRSRLTTFFRIYVMIPHLVWSALWGIPAAFVMLANWFVVLFKGQSPDNMYEYLSRYLKYTTRVTAYYLYLCEPFPPYNGTDEYSLDTDLGPNEKQSRLVHFFRGILVIPAIVVLYVFGIVVGLIQPLSWLAIMFTGRQPEGFQSFGESFMRISTRLSAYLWGMTTAYPNSRKTVPPSTPNAGGGQMPESAVASPIS